VQVYDQVLPFWTYAYFVSLLVLALLAEFFGYKTTIILSGLIGGIGNCAVLLWTNGVGWMRFDQVLVGIAFANHTVLSSYIYQISPPLHFHRIVRTRFLICLLRSANRSRSDCVFACAQASYTRTAILGGRVSAALLGTW
jgi:hypothetical protein